MVFTLSLLLLKLFLWRLKEKYVIRDFHPLVLFYLLGFVLTPIGVDFWMLSLVLRIFFGSVARDQRPVCSLLYDIRPSIPVLCDVVRYGIQ